MPVSIIVVFFCILFLATAIIAVEGLKDEAPVASCIKGGLSFVVAFAGLYLAAASEVGIV